MARCGCAVESFSVTANNVTYAVIGDQFGYWNFFPGEGEWGVVPMWGHAVVEASEPPRDRGRASGSMAICRWRRISTCSPGKVRPGGFTDMRGASPADEPDLQPVRRLAADPEHDPARETERMIFGPLFKTGFLIESFMRREAWFGAEQALLTCASSKTALALASVMRDKSPADPADRPDLGRERGLREGSGLYDGVLSYDAITTCAQVPSVSVDFAGNAALLHAIHTQMGDNLRHSCTVGATHVGGRIRARQWCAARAGTAVLFRARSGRQGDRTVGQSPSFRVRRRFELGRFSRRRRRHFGD